MLQKQTVSQNVKVNLYKPTRVPKSFKEQQAPPNGTPNIRALPSFSFHSNIQQPASVLYGERFGNARTVQVSPFERMLAEEAVDGNRALEVAKLKNSLESSKLKKVQAEPILTPAKRGETEEDRYMARATASMEDNRPPFRVSSVDEQGTLGVSFKSRLPDSEFVRQSRLKNLTTPEHVASLKLPPNTIKETLLQAEEEGAGQRAVRESETFRTPQPPRESYFARGPEQSPLIEESDGQPSLGREQELGEPEIPNRLTAYGEEADPLVEVVPTQGETEAEGAGRRGRPVEYSDTPHRIARETASKNRKADKHYRQNLARKLFSALKK